VDDPDDALPIPLRPGQRFRRHAVTLSAGATLPFVDEEWRGALVVVEQGAVDLCCSRGARRRFTTGAVLFLDGLGLVALNNPGTGELRLVALSRRQ
jgi:hypothetical protein